MTRGFRLCTRRPWEKQAHCVHTACTVCTACTPHASSSSLFYALLAGYQGSRVGIQQWRPPLHLLTNAMVVVAAHTPCQGGWGVQHRKTSSAQPAPKRLPHGVPKPVEQSFRHVSRFGPHGVLIPVWYPGPSGNRLVDQDIHVTQLESSPHSLHRPPHQKSGKC